MFTNINKLINKNITDLIMKLMHVQAHSQIHFQKEQTAGHMHALGFPNRLKYFPMMILVQY